MRRQRGRTALVLCVCMALIAIGVAGPVGSPAAVADPVTDALLDDVEDQLITTRPPLGQSWVVDLSGTGTGERILARTLQGLVNRTEARLYLRDPGDGSGSHWVDHYSATSQVDFAGTISLLEALDEFASEIDGFVVVDPDAEPWTVNVGVSIAHLDNVLLTPPSMVAALEARGLTEADDLRGRWPDALSAYQAAATTYRDQLPSDNIAVLRPTDTGYDFAVQQGIFTIMTRPNDPDWPQMSQLISDSAGEVVFGYLSDTGEEEGVAVGTLALNGMVLVPTDTTRNLSFHLAVGADRDRTPAPMPDVSSVDPCVAEDVNVVVAMTDGDNLNVPLNHFVRPENWKSPQRGELPLGWSMAPGMEVLAPAAWDMYAEQATANDELVAMIGWAYGAPALLADATTFYERSFALMRALGMRTFWSLGGGLETTFSPGWDFVDGVAGEGGVPDSVLVGYGGGVAHPYYSPAGRPAFTSRSSYSQTPAQIEGYVRDLIDAEPDERPLVTFMSATNWSNPVAELSQRLLPLEAEGVRYLTPLEAAACVPDAPDSIGPGDLAPGECLAGGEVISSGLELISGPAAAEITQRPTSFALPTTGDAPDEVAAGSQIDYRLTIEVDPVGFASEVLENRVRPVIEAGYGSELGDTAWVTMNFVEMDVPFPLPMGVSPLGEPSADSDGPAVTASWGTVDSDPAVVLHTTSFVADTRSMGDGFTMDLEWSVTADDVVEDLLVDQLAGPVSFDLDLTIGVLLGNIEFTGSVRAPWSCEPADGVLARTLVVAPFQESTTTTTTSTTSSTTTSTSTSSTTSLVPPGPPPAPTTTITVEGGVSPTTDPTTLASAGPVASGPGSWLRPGGRTQPLGVPGHQPARSASPVSTTPRYTG